MGIFILLGTMVICFLIGMPIAYSLAMAAIAGALSIGIPLEALMLKISDGVSKVAMLTIPFFVLAGAIMAEGGMARRLVAFADVLVGFTRLRGGLSIVNVLATTFLSGISGSAVADTFAIGSVMIPQMEKAGYPRVFATNLIITSSVQALLVPPSHNAVLYSLATGGTMLLNLGIGLCHPPVGAILFVGCAVGKVTIEQVMRKIWPFYAVMFVVLMFVTYIPEISLWLPRHVLR